jgi:hypothetical protein
MTTTLHTFRHLALGLAALGASAASLSCSDEATIERSEESLEPGAGGGAAGAGGETPADTSALFAFVSQVETQETSSTFIELTEQMPSGALDLSNALELSGYGTAELFRDKLYVTNGERLEVTRYRVENNELAAEESLSFQGRGITFINELFFIDAEHAYLVNGDQLNVIEWNPTLMTITGEHDLSALRREGWGNEYRGGFARQSDGKLFFYWAYTNDRIEFINDFVVGVFDTEAKALSILVEPTCPASAGFGGFFDERGDLYLIADSFGGFTFLGSDDPKSACVLRIANGETTFDPSYRFLPTEALGGGLSPWGFYYAGNGLAYTTAVDPARLPEYDSVFEFIFAPVHDGWTLNVENQSAARIENMPPDAVGFASVTLDNELLVPRSTAAADIYEVDDIQTTVYRLSGSSGAATRLFTMPGYLNDAIRLR